MNRHSPNYLSLSLSLSLSLCETYTRANIAYAHTGTHILAWNKKTAASDTMTATQKCDSTLLSPPLGDEPGASGGKTE